MKLNEKIASEEGFSDVLYICPAGYKSIGYGFNLDATRMPREVADLWLDLNIQELKRRLAHFEWLSKLDETRQVVIYDMSYQMGINGMLAFTSMINALRAERYHEAAEHLLDSRYARQTPNRAMRNAEILRTGEI